MNIENGNIKMYEDIIFALYSDFYFF